MTPKNEKARLGASLKMSSDLKPEHHDYAAALASMKKGVFVHKDEPAIISALRLAQRSQQAEPVAWMHGDHVWTNEAGAIQFCDHFDIPCSEIVRLYAAPTPKQAGVVDVEALASDLSAYLLEAEDQPIPRTEYARFILDWFAQRGLLTEPQLEKCPDCDAEMILVCSGLQGENTSCAHSEYCNAANELAELKAELLPLVEAREKASKGEWFNDSGKIGIQETECCIGELDYGNDGDFVEIAANTIARLAPMIKGGR